MIGSQQSLRSGAVPVPQTAAATLQRLVPRFVDPTIEEDFQQACVQDTRNGLALLALVGLAAAAATLHGAWVHLPHEQGGYLVGQGIRVLLLVASLLGLGVLFTSDDHRILTWTGTVLLALGCLTLALRMTVPPPEDAGFLVELLHTTRDGATILLIVAMAVLTLLAGHFQLHAAIFAVTLGTQLVIANHWPDGLENAAGFSYAFGIGFLFVLALGAGIQRMRRNIHVARLQLQHANEQLHEFAIRDYLTDCLNRRHFYDLAEAELKRAHRYDAPLSLMMLDLDHFKIINDRHGHACGDAVLCKVVDIVQGRLRTSDVLARLGGEEFVVLLPETRLEEARQLAERLRQAIAGTTFEHRGQPMQLTASWGVAEYRADDQGIDNLLDRADRALYAAKGGGRDRVCVDAVDGDPVDRDPVDRDPVERDPGGRES